MSEIQRPDEQTTLEPAKELVTILIAQFNSYRAEIQARSSAQTTLVTFNVTVLGVISGFYFSYGANVRLLFVASIISPMLGIVFLDHAIMIGNLGRFIQTKIIPRLSEVMSNTRIDDFEVWIRQFERRMGSRLVLLGSPVLVMFAILPAGALIVPILTITEMDLLSWILSVTGIILITIFCCFWTLVVFGWIWIHGWVPSDSARGARP